MHVQPSDGLPSEFSNAPELGDILIEIHRRKRASYNFHRSKAGKASPHPANWHRFVRERRLRANAVEDRPDDRCVSGEASGELHRECKRIWIGGDENHNAARPYHSSHLRESNVLRCRVVDVVNHVGTVDRVKCSVIEGQCADICILKFMRNTNVRIGRPSQLEPPLGEVDASVPRAHFQNLPVGAPPQRTPRRSMRSRRVTVPVECGPCAGGRARFESGRLP